jgi:nucleoside phosphorylase
VNYFASKERPVFLNFLNREANHASKASRLARDDVRAIDVLTVSHCCGMTANLSQMIEYAYRRRHLKNVIEGLIRSKILISTSHSTDLDEFIASRQKIYRNVPENYPMYFGNNSELERFPILKRNHFSMTKLLRRDIFDYDESRILPFGSHALKSDIKKFESGLPDIQHAVMNNADIAITRANIEKVVNVGQLPPPVLAATARIFSARYFDHYSGNSDAVVPSGVGLVGYLDDLRFFPHYDIPVLESILCSLGWHRMFKLKDIRAAVYSDYGSPLHREFVHHLNSFISACFTVVSGQMNREIEQDNAETIRRMVRNYSGALLSRVDVDRYKIESFSEFLEGSIGSIRSAATKEGLTNAEFGKAWIESMGMSRTVTILLLTATDVEDDALREALRLDGYKHLTYRAAGRVIANEYARGSDRKIYHVRSSAGSSGSSGSELTAYDAFSAISPDFTIAVGICFGLKQGVQQLGDVLVSEKVTDYEMVRQGDEEIRERGTKVPAASMLLSASRALRAQYNEGVPNVFHGEILSGMKLIDSTKFRTELALRFPDAIGGEMEATGIAASAERIKKDWIVVKAICDWAEGKGDGEQKIAAKNAAEFALKLSGIVASVVKGNGDE